MCRSKYNARKTEVDGYIFDSSAEARRYSELKILEAAGEIIGLVLQPKYEIVVNQKRIGSYRADFRYHDVVLHKLIVEDVKGMETPVFRLKKKLVEALYDIEIVIVK